MQANVINIVSHRPIGALVVQSPESVTEGTGNRLSLGFPGEFGYGFSEALCFCIPDVQRHGFPTCSSA